VATSEQPPPPQAGPPPAPVQQQPLPVNPTTVVRVTPPQQLRTYMQPAQPWIAPWTGFIPHW